jgi:hypothetical protein
MGNNQFGVTGEQLPRPLVVAVVDRGSNRLDGVPVTFEVMGGGGNFSGHPTVTANTDSDGRLWLTPVLGPATGVDVNVFQATAPGVAAPAVFVASAAPAGQPADTRITGVVLDNMNGPIAGVSMRIEGTTLQTETDGQGQFVLASAPIGYIRLIADGSTAQRPGSWPMLEFAMYTNSGQDNTIGMPIYLLPIDVTRGIQVDEQRGGTITLPELPGFSLTVAPGSALFPGGGRIGTVSATLVHADKVPMVPGFGQQPRFIVTIQPPGVHFDPPATLTIPNVDGLHAGEVTELYSFDHDLGQFVAIGTGTVSDDGSIVQSDPGVGIIKGGWHCGGNPAATGTASCINVSLGVLGASDDPDATGAPPAVAAQARAEAVDLSAPKIGIINTCVKLLATGTPFESGGSSRFEWQIPTMPGLTVLSSPACNNQSTCVAEIRMSAPAIVTAAVKYIYTSPGGATGSDDESVKVKFVKVNLKLKELRLVDANKKLFMDIPTFPAVEIGDPVWKSGTLPSLQPRFALVGNALGGSRTFRMNLVFEVDPPPPVDVADVMIEGSISPDIFAVGYAGYPGGSFSTVVKLKKNEGELKVDNLDTKLALPASTYFFDPMHLTWNARPKGSCSTIPIGTADLTVHILLDEPHPALAKIYYSVIELGTKGVPATTPQQAAELVWSKFGDGTGPKDVKGWDNRAFVYYPAGTPFESSCAMALEELLRNPTGGGRCGLIARLMQEALLVNRVVGNIRSVTPARCKPDAANPTAFWAEGFLVKNLQIVEPPAGSFLFAFPDQPEYKYPFVTFGDPANDLIPEPPGRMYAYVFNQSGEPGQNEKDPSQKAHINHAVIDMSDPRVTMPFLDPSYGLTYTGPVDFQSKAVNGYFLYLTSGAISIGGVPVPAGRAKAARKTGTDTGVLFLGPGQKCPGIP